MQVLLLTMLYNANITLKPLLIFSVAASSKGIIVSHSAPFALATLKPINLASLTKSVALRFFYKRVDRLWVFTRKKNPNKLYVDNNNGVFLTPGIVLKFMNLDQSRFLKKRLRTWYNYIRALKLLQRKPFVLYLNDLNGKKSIFLNKLKSSDIKIAWLFIALFVNSYKLPVKKCRRIKR